MHPRAPGAIELANAFLQTPADLIQSEVSVPVRVPLRGKTIAAPNFF